jgi:hypothetical protein
MTMRGAPLLVMGFTVAVSLFPVAMSGRASAAETDAFALDALRE